VKGLGASDNWADKKTLATFPSRGPCF